MSKSFDLALAGFGHVGRSFFRLIQDKAAFIENRYGLHLTLQVILEQGGGLLSASPSGLNDPEIADLPLAELRSHPLWKPGLDFAQAIARLTPGVLVLATPSSLKTGEPGLSLTRLALHSGWHVVTADKAPLVVDFSGLRRKAEQKRLCLKFSGATAAALPALDVGLYCLAGSEISLMEGILNGTTNFILTEMGKGRSYDACLEEAKARGIAEPDPSLDVSGRDTAIKLLLIARAIWESDITLEDIAIEGIAQLPLHFVRRATREGKKVKLIGRLERETKELARGEKKEKQGKIYASVQPQAIDSNHPLFNVDGTNKAIAFTTDTMGIVSVSGGKSDPRGAAAALLKDILHIST